MQRLNRLAKLKPFETREETMRRTIRWLAIGAAAGLTLPAMAQTVLTDKNTKTTNVIGAGGAGTGNNGNGNAKFDSAKGVWEVNGGGDDIWSTADGMTFVSTDLAGDGNITARILDEKGGSGDGWARDGVMIRESDEIGRAH